MVDVELRATQLQEGEHGLDVVGRRERLPQPLQTSCFGHRVTALVHGRTIITGPEGTLVQRVLFWGMHVYILSTLEKKSRKYLVYTTTVIVHSILTTGSNTPSGHLVHFTAEVRAPSSLGSEHLWQVHSKFHPSSRECRRSVVVQFDTT